MERLMNRAMSNDWQTFTQLSGSMVQVNAPEEYIGMSDTDELVRAGQAIAGAEGFGEEVLVDYGDDLRNLGFNPQ